MTSLAGSTTRTANFERAVRLTAQLPTLIAAYARLRAGKEVVAPDASLNHAANFLYMLNGEKPKSDMARMFDVCLILHAEHGFNASTFSGRVTAATLSDIYSCMTSAIGTLKGPLHGGANTAVMNMLMKIGSVDAVESSLDVMLAEGQKIMGFGHRVYKVVDPRALVLKEFAGKLAKQSDDPKWYEMSSALEKLMKERKGIDMNVDFYSASTYFYMGIEPDMYTTIFALQQDLRLDCPRARAVRQQPPDSPTRELDRQRRPRIRGARKALAGTRATSLRRRHPRLSRRV